MIREPGKVELFISPDRKRTIRTRVWIESEEAISTRNLSKGLNSSRTNIHRVLKEKQSSRT